MLDETGKAIKTEEPVEAIQPLPAGFSGQLDQEVDLAGGELPESEEYAGAIGRTMFDTPASKDNTVTVLLPPDQISRLPSQSLVRIKSRPVAKGGDGRQYLGAVVQGPFAEPDGLRADAPIVVTTTVRGATFIPRYHGRVQVEILGEELDDTLAPPRFRPLPNSPVFPLSQEETIARLKLMGNVVLGLAVGYEDMPVALPAGRKDVFPRHVGVLGTTGGGKSTTVSGLVGKLSASGVAVVIFDTEGEYTHMMHPTADPVMLAALQRRGLKPEGLANMGIYYLAGRETTNTTHTRRREFGLEFSNLSPHAVIEILGLNEAQEQRFMKAYDLARRILMELKIYPSSEQEKQELLELDELESGYPRLTLEMMYDVVRACAHKVSGEPDYPFFNTRSFYEQREKVMQLFPKEELLGHPLSWRKVQGSLGRLQRLKIFDNEAAPLPNYDTMTRPGLVTVIDLSDTDSPQINNLVIAEILRGLQAQQEQNYAAAEAGEQLRKVVIVIEEAHEFLSAERIKQMPILFQQVARIARRGRKRWLGLMFVTQLPQHLPDEVLGLINNHILHKIGDANVISRLKRSIGGIDGGLWDRLPNLAPGQAIVSATSMARPLLVAVDPTPYKLRMID